MVVFNRKGILVWVLFAALLAGMFSGVAFADEGKIADENGFIIENGVLTGYEGDGGEVNIPDTVTTIGEYVFQEKNIISVDIPRSVIIISTDAFPTARR